MINVPEEIKELYKQDSINKNFRVHFVKGEYRDLVNADIVSESVVFTESISSSTPIKFGLTEASSIQFQTFFNANIRNVKIICYEEIDISSLSNDFQNLYGTVSDDVPYVFYRILYGTFYVDSCKRDTTTDIRTIIAYQQKIDENVFGLYFNQVRSMLSAVRQYGSEQPTNKKALTLKYADVNFLYGYLAENKFMPKLLDDLGVEFSTSTATPSYFYGVLPMCATTWSTYEPDPDNYELYHKTIFRGYMFSTSSTGKYPVYSTADGYYPTRFSYMNNFTYQLDTNGCYYIRWLASTVASEYSYMNSRLYFIVCSATSHINSEFFPNSYSSGKALNYIEGTKDGDYYEAYFTPLSLPGSYYQYSDSTGENFTVMDCHIEFFIPVMACTKTTLVEVDDILIEEDIIIEEEELLEPDSTFAEEELIEEELIESDYPQYKRVSFYSSSSTPSMPNNPISSIQKKTLVNIPAEGSMMRFNTVTANPESANFTSIIDYAYNTKELNFNQYLLAYAELHAFFVLLKRDGTIKFKRLIDHDEIFPRNDLYPSDELYPYDEDFLIQRSMCKSAWWDDEIATPYGAVQFKFKDDTVTVKVVNDYTNNPDAYEVLDISDNIFMKYLYNENNTSLTSTERAAITTVLQLFANHIKNIKYYVSNIEMRSLPYMEAGDELLVAVKDNAISTFTLRHRISGVQALMDNIEAR